MEKPLTAFNSVDIINGKFYKKTVIWSGEDRMSEQMLNQIKTLNRIKIMNISKMVVTNIQFFDYSDENTGCTDYSANIILDEKLVIQLSGNSEESHVASVPSSAECYYNNEDLQDKACKFLDIDDVNAFLEDNDIENNFNFLSEEGGLLNK